MNKKIVSVIMILSLLSVSVPIVNAYEYPDNQAPFIQSVIISSRIPQFGNNILVTVVVFDNVAVTRVSADETAMIQTKDGEWKAIVPAKYGTNNVLIVAQDAARNSASSKSIGYTTIDRIENYNDGNKNYDSDTNPIKTPTKSPVKKAKKVWWWYS